MLLTFWPQQSVWIVYRAAAAGLVLFGALRIVKYFRDDVDESREHQVFAHGAMLAVAGILLMVYIAGMKDWLPVLVGSSLLLVACIRAQASLDLYRKHVRLWMLPLAVCGVEAVMALILLIFGVEIRIKLILAGVVLLLETAADIFSRICFSRAERKARSQEQKPAEAPAEAPAEEPVKEPAKDPV